MDENSITIIPGNEVHILVTEEDKTGDDILAMSDFFSDYVHQLTNAVRNNSVTQFVQNIPLLTLRSLVKLFKERRSFHGDLFNCYPTLIVFQKIFVKKLNIKTDLY